MSYLAFVYSKKRLAIHSELIALHFVVKCLAVNCLWNLHLRRLPLELSVITQRFRSINEDLKRDRFFCAYDK